MYVDSAVLLKLVVREPDSLHYARMVDGQELCSSEITRTECFAAMLRKERERAFDRAGRQRAWKQIEADVAAGRIDLLPLSAEVLAASRRILEACHPHVALRSLDAIHLASADRLQSWPLCTNDLRMREAAVRLGMPLCLLPRTP
jgi:predicted nucleic acid-binding protein